MNFYPKAQKESVIKKLIELAKDPNPPLGAISEIAKEAGLSGNTVYQWNSELKKKMKATSDTGVSSSGKTLSSEAKFQVVLATASMSELRLGEYLRINGILKEDLERWRRTCASANDKDPSATSKYRSDLSAEKVRTKKLEAELKRKEKALAETAALLVLRGKADAIWGDNEVD